MKKQTDGLPKLSTRLRGWRTKRMAMRAALRNDVEALAQVAPTVEGDLALAVDAALAKGLMCEQEFKAARVKFADILRRIKSQDDQTSNYVRAFCLQNLAELRGALPDSAFFAKKGRSLPVASYVRTMLYISKPIERNMIGTAVTATR